MFASILWMILNTCKYTSQAMSFLTVPVKGQNWSDHVTRQEWLEFKWKSKIVKTFSLD